MGTREDIQNDLQEAFADDDELGQAYGTFTATRTTQGEYVPGSGTGGTTTESYAGEYWRDEFTTFEREQLQLTAADIKLGALANRVERAPQPDDRWTLETGQVIDIRTVSPDPVGASYTITARMR